VKTLHLLRHAKSTWDMPAVPDRERRLNDRGRRAAARMGKALSEFLEPMAISVSPATRAQETLAGLCSTWPELARLPHATEEDLYTFSSTDLINWISARGNELPALFLLGHNPGLTELINTLTQRYTIDNLPTAGYLQLSLDIDSWDQLRSCVAVAEHVVLPRQLD
jgi:phosphohistidine phosphatase